MSKKRGDVSLGVPDAPAEGVPLAELSGLAPEGETPRPDPFKGKRGAKGDPLTRAQHWVVGESPANGCTTVLYEGRSRAGALKWVANVRTVLVASWQNVRIVRVKPVQPDKWSW